MSVHDSQTVRLRFEGSRFDHAELPVPALQELIRFQNLITSAAQAQWEHHNPDQEPPTNFEEFFSLTLKRVEDGSAIPVLERETEDHSLDEIFGDSLDDVHSLFVDVYSDPEFDELSRFPEWANTDAFWQFGTSIENNESITLTNYTADDRKIKITSELRAKIIPKLQTRLKKIEAPQRETKYDGIVVGKVLRIDRQKKNFQLLNFSSKREMHVRFHNEKKGHIAAQSLADGMSGMQTYIRVLGDIRFADGKPEKVLKATNIDALKPTSSPRLDRIAEIAALEQGWVDGFYGEPLDIDELNSAIIFSEELEKIGDLPFAEIFPNEEGEIEFQWANPKMVLSARRTPSGKFEYHFKKRGHPGEEGTKDHFTELNEYIKKFAHHEDQ